MVGRHSAASPCFQRIPSGGLWIIRVCARLLLNIVFLTGAAACKERPLPNSALPQKAYVWQRAWTGEVRQSLETAADLLDGVVVLGAHLRQTASGVPESVPSNVDWSALARFGKPVGVAVRVEGAMLPDAIFAGGVREFA